MKQEIGWSSVLHYLADFMFVGPAGTRVCLVLLHTMKTVAERFSVSLAPGKTDGPATVVKFLGIAIDWNVDSQMT